MTPPLSEEIKELIHGGYAPPRLLEILTAAEKLEAKVAGLEAENQRLRQGVESRDTEMTKDHQFIRQMEKERDDMEAENTRLQNQIKDVTNGNQFMQKYIEMAKQNKEAEAQDK